MPDRNVSPETRQRIKRGCGIAAFGGSGVALVALAALVLMLLRIEGCSWPEDSCSESDDPLIAAASRGDVVDVEDKLSDGADPNREVDGTTALLCVTDETSEFSRPVPPGAGNIEMVETLLKAGSDATPEAVENAARADNTEIVGLLLDAGAEPPPEAVSVAARADNTEIVGLLLDAGAEPPPDAVRNAAGAGQLEIVEVLLDAGATAQPDSIQASFCGVLHLFDTVVDDDRLFQLLPMLDWGQEGSTRMELAELLLEEGLSPDGGERGSSPLLCAAWHGGTAGVDLLIDHGADVDYGGDVSWSVVEAVLRGYDSDQVPEDEVSSLPKPREDEADNLPPLVGAAWAGRTEVATRLLDAGADPNLPADGAFTPLLGAATLGKSELVDSLLANGADPVPPVRDGVPTPAEAARTAGHDEIASTLDTAEAAD